VFIHNENLNLMIRLLGGKVLWWLSCFAHGSLQLNCGFRAMAISIPKVGARKRGAHRRDRVSPPLPERGSKPAGRAELLSVRRG
jgi:hypothetical protein